MSQIYCTATIELNQFNNPSLIVDYIKESGLEASYEDDVIFVGSTIEDDDAKNTLLSICITLATHIMKEHDVVIFSCDGEDSVDSFEIIIKNKEVYMKDADLVVVVNE